VLAALLIDAMKCQDSSFKWQSKTYIPDDVVSTVRETAEWAKRACHRRVECLIIRLSMVS